MVMHPNKSLVMVVALVAILSVTRLASGQGAPLPTPEHTGFRALVGTLGGDFKTFPQRPSTRVILGIGAGAALLAHPVDDEYRGLAPP